MLERHQGGAPEGLEKFEFVFGANDWFRSLFGLQVELVG
jgi:hypothetical protein